MYLPIGTILSLEPLPLTLMYPSTKFRLLRMMPAASEALNPVSSKVAKRALLRAPVSVFLPIMDATGRFYGTKGIYPRRPLEDMVHHENYDMEKRQKFLEIDPFISWLSNEERERRVKEGGGIWPGG